MIICVEISDRDFWNFHPLYESFSEEQRDIVLEQYCELLRQEVQKQYPSHDVRVVIGRSLLHHLITFFDPEIQQQVGSLVEKVEEERKWTHLNKQSANETPSD